MHSLIDAKIEQSPSRTLRPQELFEIFEKTCKNSSLVGKLKEFIGDGDSTFTYSREESKAFLDQLVEFSQTLSPSFSMPEDIFSSGDEELKNMEKQSQANHLLERASFVDSVDNLQDNISERTASTSLESYRILLEKSREREGFLRSQMKSQEDIIRKLTNDMASLNEKLRETTRMYEAAYERENSSLLEIDRLNDQIFKLEKTKGILPIVPSPGISSFERLNCFSSNSSGVTSTIDGSVDTKVSFLIESYLSRKKHIENLASLVKNFNNAEGGKAVLSSEEISGLKAALAAFGDEQSLVQKLHDRFKVLATRNVELLESNRAAFLNLMELKASLQKSSLPASTTNSRLRRVLFALLRLFGDQRRLVEALVSVKPTSVFSGWWFGSSRLLCIVFLYFVLACGTCYAAALCFYRWLNVVQLQDFSMNEIIS